MDSNDGIELLLDVGLDRQIRSSTEVEITAGEDRWSRRHVLLLRHSPSPQEIDRAVAALRPRVDGVLFVVPRAGRALVKAAARDDRVAYAAVDDAVVSFQGEVRRRGDDRQLGPARPVRASWTRLAMLRLFALSPVQSWSQSQIARRLGVSHVAVSKQLPLRNELVERAVGGWRVVDRARCWDLFMVDYPGPRGLSTFWAATGELADQLDRVERVVSVWHGSAAAVSGDFAADFYAPWRRPSRVILYVTHQPALEGHGFATVRSADATVELRAPRDPTVLAMSHAWPSMGGRSARRYTDPLIAAWDLQRSPGGDVDSAVDQLRAQALRMSLWS